MARPLHSGITVALHPLIQPEEGDQAPFAFFAGQLAEWAGLLGSAGGPESASTPLGLAVLLTPSLLLGPAFVVAMASLHQAAAVRGRVWSQAGLAFAIAYAVLTGLVYFVQLTLVAPRILRGETDGIELLLFEPFNSFLYAVDILGYSFMILATLFAAPAVAGKSGDRCVADVRRLRGPCPCHRLLQSLRLHSAA